MLETSRPLQSTDHKITKSRGKKEERIIEMCDINLQHNSQFHIILIDKCDAMLHQFTENAFTLHEYSLNKK